jgi:hypothetical protein
MGDVMSWSRAEEYNLKALDCLSIASRSSNEDERLRMFDRACSWLRLAELAEKNSTVDLVYEWPPKPEM